MEGSTCFTFRGGSGRAAPDTWGMKPGQAVVVGGAPSEECLCHLGGCIHPRRLQPLPHGEQWSQLPVGREGRSVL